MNIRLSLITALSTIAIIALVIGSCEKPERLFKLKTLEIEESDYSYTEATVKARIVDMGSKPVEDYGFLISQNQNPVIGMNSTARYFGTKPSRGEYQWTFTGLNPGTTYFFRGFAIIGGSPVYAPEVIEFTTLQTDKPVVTISAAPSVYKDSVRISGAVTSENGLSVTKRGFCWNTSPNPDLGNSLDTTVNGTGAGDFSARIEGLQPGTTYYLRAYAINSKGVSYNTADVTIATHNLPLVTTSAITDLSNTSARSGGDVTAEGGVTVSARGVCWSTSTGPTADLVTKTTNGSGPGIFQSDITSLTPGTKYYIRAYATNAYGTSYGEELPFTTTKSPDATTLSADILSTTSAILNGSVNANNFATTVSFEYGHTTSYGITVNAIPYTVTGTAPTTVTATITGLTPSTTYNFRIIATNAGGTVYGENQQFTTTDPLMVTDVDGNVYNTVQIGTQIWMKENLKTTRYSNGISIPNLTVKADWTAAAAGAYSWYDNDEGTYKNTYGALYNWHAVNSFRLCPAGWHVPTLAEWTTLGANQSSGGGRFKEAGTLHWSSPNTAATNETGFTGLPAGSRFNGNFSGVGLQANWWISVSESSIIRDARLYYNSDVFEITTDIATQGFSVRCIKGDLFVQPVLSTAAFSDITTTSAKSGGAIITDGGADITLKGICWSTSSGPTIADYRTEQGTGMDSFVSNITGLSPGTKYYVRSYATNSQGTSYGDEKSFTTHSPPEAITGAATAVGTSAATLNGTVNARNISTTVVFEYGTTSSYGSTVVADQSPVTGTSAIPVSATITNLDGNTTYYFRVKATSPGGTTYGSEESFITSGQTVTDIDGNVYNTVQIGTQIWMKENLKTTQFNYGTPILLVTNNSEWMTLSTAAYSWYDNNEVPHKENYGGLYNWYAINSGGLCPLGWHVPTDTEWTTLENFLIGSGYNYDGSTSGNKIAKALADKDLFPLVGWWGSYNPGAIGNTDYPEKRNATGFSALPGGLRTAIWPGGFIVVNQYGYFWSSTESSTSAAYIRYLNYDASEVSRAGWPKNAGISVRCIKGELPSAKTSDATAIASTSVTLKGIIYPNGASATVTFEYGTTTSYGLTVTASQSPVTGSVPVDVSYNLTGLTPNTTYHYRVKAVNSGGTSYGSDMTFTTPAQITDADGNTYNTVIIGTQTWMQENLKTTKYNDNTDIQNVTGSNWGGIGSPAYCWYNNDKSNYGDLYGALYNWFAVNTNKLCPSGWHVPTDTEWNTLENYLIDNGFNYDGSTTGNKIAKALGNTTNWTFSNVPGAVGNTDYPNKRNETGFSVLPAGARVYTGDFGYLGTHGIFWTATIRISDAYIRAMLNDNVNFYQEKDYLSTGLSVRCVKN